MNAIAKIKGIYERGRWNLSNLLRAPFRQPIDTIFNMMLR
ncbi:coniferyl-aldehyde dehydrogenase [Mesorhizobium muleiense]|uniref:Coniferyl-aldehyde dehydrogenase n=1 Tax=Mesorhizobium muleiense TaxID=1004279 RepID=A0A1G8IHR6_9HYPH|nr:coniferyl-aldehyde dehydrogenase [Mesorhizobium muleiense]